MKYIDKRGVGFVWLGFFGGGVIRFTIHVSLIFLLHLRNEVIIHVSEFSNYSSINTLVLASKCKNAWN